MPSGTESDPVEVRAIIIGQESGSVITVTPDLSSGAVDAFARQRFSQPVTLFDSKQLFDNQPLFFDDQELTGGGTGSSHNPNTASTTLSVSNGVAGSRARQTFMRFNYQPGKSQLGVFTAVLGEGVAGITRRVGIFDDNNGLFFELDGTTLSVVIRSYATGAIADTVINQSNWNGDKLDGTGASGKTINTNYAHIYFIDYEWLGVGQVRFGVFVDGEPVVVHSSRAFNRRSTVYMSTPNLPVRYEIANDGTGPNALLRHICCSVVSEGGQEALGQTRSLARGTTGITTADNALWVPILSIRLKSTHLGQSIDIISFSVICTSTADYEAGLFFNPAIGGSDAASWTDLANSAIQYDVSRTNANTLSYGQQFASALATQTNQSRTELGATPDNARRLGSSIAGVPEQIVLAARRYTGSTETFFGSLTWRELT